MMKIEDAIRRVMALKLLDDQFAQVVLILADVFDGMEGLAQLDRMRENGRARAKRRRERDNVSEGEWYALRGQVLRRDGEVCTYCGAKDGPWHIDHVHPLSRGGKSELSNLVVACPRCNQSKGDKLVEEWTR